MGRLHEYLCNLPFVMRYVYKCTVCKVKFYKNGGGLPYDESVNWA